MEMAENDKSTFTQQLASFVPTCWVLVISWHFKVLTPSLILINGLPRETENCWTFQWKKSKTQEKLALLCLFCRKRNLFNSDFYYFAHVHDHEVLRRNPFVEGVLRHRVRQPAAGSESESNKTTAKLTWVSVTYIRGMGEEVFCNRLAS